MAVGRRFLALSVRELQFLLASRDALIWFAIQFGPLPTTRARSVLSQGAVAGRLPEIASVSTSVVSPVGCLLGRRAVRLGDTARWCPEVAGGRWFGTVGMGR